MFALAISIGLSTACNNESKNDTSTDSGKTDDIATSEVPQAVQSAFSAKYADATDVQWGNATENGNKTYKAKFSRNGAKIKAEFNPDGSFIKED